MKLLKHRLAVVLAVATLAALVSVSAPTASAQVAPTVIDPTCAFPIIVNQDDANVAYPDTNSTYWAMPTDFSIGDVVTITGEFAYARYMSFNSYDASGSSVGGLRDEAMLPDSGSINPFTSGQSLTGVPRDYTVTVNVTNSPQLVSPVPGAIDAIPGAGWLLIRVYVPFDAASPSGSVAIPSITVNSVTKAGCTAFGSEPAIVTLAAMIMGQAIADAIPPAENPEFSFSGGGGLFPNADNKYVYATTSWKPGRLIIVRGLAPSSPDTPTQGLYPEQQLRYWSMCTNLLVTPAPVVECARDHLTALDSSGYYTFVIGADRDKPSDESITRDSATWLKWFGPIGEALPDAQKPDGNLILRNMLPNASFTNAVQDIPVTQSNAAARATMGLYYPEATYCQRSVFENYGAAACFVLGPKFTG
jgi:hypothetical protein